jgi:hypothetical protein
MTERRITLSLKKVMSARSPVLHLLIVVALVVSATLGQIHNDEASVSSDHIAGASLDRHVDRSAAPASSPSGHCMSGAICSGAVLPATLEAPLPIAIRSSSYSVMRERPATGRILAPSLKPPRERIVV